MYRRYIVLLGLFLFGLGSVYGQGRLLISQYMYNGLILNPAYAGSQQQFSLATTFRRQWVNVEGSPAYGLFSAHTPIFSNRIGIGVLGYGEQIGVHQEYGGYIMGAYKVPLRVGYLSIGISGGFSSRNSDYTRLDLLEPSDVFLSSRSTSLTPNFGVGLYFYNSRMYAGISVPFLLDTRRISVEGVNENGILRDARSYYFTIGGILGREGAPIRFLPSMLLRLQENNSLAGDVNLNIILQKRVLLGGSFRWFNSFVLLSQLILNENLRVMYSYDFNTTQLAVNTSGTHEIMLNYRVVIRTLVRDPHCSAYF